MEVTTIDGKWAIISEYINGKTLDQLMEENAEKTTISGNGKVTQVNANANGKLRRAVTIFCILLVILTSILIKSVL